MCRCLLALLVGLTVAAAEYHVPKVTLPLMTVAPTLDGMVNPEEWQGAARMIGFSDHTTAAIEPPEAYFYVGSDGKELFMAVVSQTPPQGMLLNRVKPAPENGNARVWADDTIEILLDPLPGVGGDRERVYQGAFNAQGAIWDTAYLNTGGGANWRGNWRIGSAVHDDLWHFEIALPLADMQVTDADLGLAMGVRLCRNWRRCLVARGGEWSPLGGAYKTTATMPRVSWDAKAPVVQMTSLRSANGKQVDIVLEVRNPHDTPVQCRAVIGVDPANSAPAREEKELTVAPGAVETVRLTRGFEVTEKLDTMVRVCSLDGKTDYYFRDFPWTIRRPEPMFEVETEQSQQAGLNFSYYPYHNILRVKVDIANMAERDKVTGLRLQVWPAFSNPLRDNMPVVNLTPDANGIAEIYWELPDLRPYADTGQNNDYMLEVRFLGTKADPLKRRFSRHAFEWERNDLGKSNTIVPPYTPIAVDGQVLKTVLRDHTLDGFGLFNQIRSMGTDLLAGPMRFEVDAGGKTTVLTGAKLEFVETAPHRVVTRAAWAGVLPGSADGEWDYDGAMRWRLTLQPTAEEIQHVRLVIPLKNDLCTLFHACGDGIRFNYAGRIFAGDGHVWDSSKVARNSIIGDYAPYIWAGKEDVGFCVWGENDAGWITGGEGPCQELVRDGDTLNLVLNLIDQPTTIEAARELLIGFMATPAKPMPEEWRRWAGWGVWRAPQIDDWALTLGFLGSTITWGAWGYCTETAPRDGDVRIWEKFGETRRTGKVDFAFVENWLAGYRATADTPEGREDQYKKWRINMNSAFHRMRGAPLDHPYSINCFYFNARGVRLDTAQGDTFLDEWHREAVSERDSYEYGGGRAYDLNPGESFRDYAMWWYNKAFETRAAESIYWDDIFMQSDFDVVGTAAYVRPDGNIQPASGLWDMRQLMRRTAVLQCERGMTPVNVPHMTNTHIVPELSFAQMNYCWEDRNSGDYQDRFPRDYIRAESIGRQSGNFPLALSLLSGSKEEQDWQVRTQTAVALVHEVRPTTSSPIYWDAFTLLWKFGYGKPEVTHSDYWEPGHPVNVRGLDAATLALGKPGETLVVVASYAPDGTADLELDLQALQLPAKVAAVNLETGESFAVDGNVVHVPLPHHDLRIVHLKAAD